MALSVPSRLWLGGAVHPRRDRRLIRTLCQKIRASLQEGPVRLVSDGFRSYHTEFLRITRRAEKRSSVGRPRLMPWPEVIIGRVTKKKTGKIVTSVARTVVHGQAHAPTDYHPQTSYIERLNATFRQRWAVLARKTRHGAKNWQMIENQMYFIGTIYNFCTVHHTLTCTPAVAHQITDHTWSVYELLMFRKKPAPWAPEKRRGRRSKHVQELIQRWQK